MENEKYKTFTDLLKYAIEKKYSLVETQKTYQTLSKPFYAEEIEKGNTHDLFKQNTKTESKLIEICKEELDKKFSNKN